MTTIKLPPRDPEAVYVRKSIAARRKGVGARCACGEARPEALIREKRRVVCQECKRKEMGLKTTDNHHPASKANSPIKVTIPANDHCAELNTAQYDWPQKTLENPDGSPLLKAAAWVRGFIDTILCMIKNGLHWVADLLEKADSFLTEKFGPKYWIGTPLEPFAPKR